ncbi:hypothetical protein EJB05_58044, partial [Eragrostis curvula]
MSAWWRYRRMAGWRGSPAMRRGKVWVRVTASCGVGLKRNPNSSILSRNAAISMDAERGSGATGRDWGARWNVLLSVDADKTNEAELQRAVERASSALIHGAAVLDYTSRACTGSIPGHYVIYWELLLLANMKVNDDVLERCCLEMEEAHGFVYRENRVAQGLTMDRSPILILV